MTGLTHNTTYYVVRVSATTFSLATSVANANAGTVVSLSSDGTGAQTFTATYTARPLAQQGGEEIHALNDAESPSHGHNIISYSGSLGGSNPVRSMGSSRLDFDSTPGTTQTGGDTPHNNMPLFTVVNFIIKH
jgi:microcystin-dependent protein